MSDTPSVLEHDTEPVLDAQLGTPQRATPETTETALPGDGPAEIDAEIRKTNHLSQMSDWVRSARDKETRSSRFGRMLDSVVEKATEWLRPQQPGELPVPTRLAQAMSDRVSLDEWLSYRDFDDENKLIYLTAADTFRVGFVLGMAPLLVAGTDIESQLEATLNNCPPDTVVQSGVLATSQTQQVLDAWLGARLGQNRHANLAEMALRRVEFFQAAAEHGGSLLYGGASFQPRCFFYYLSVTLPYNGAPDDAHAIEVFKKTVLGLRATMEGALKGASIPSAPLNRASFELLLAEILNPQLAPENRRDRVGALEPLPGGLVDRESRLRVQNDGTLLFTSPRDGASEVVATILTMDAPPAEGWLPNTSKLLGHPKSRDDRINCPFWLHTTVVVQHPEKAKDRVTVKQGALNKQMMSESPWYRSMMGHLFTQKEELDGLMEAARGGHPPMRVWAGIVLFNTPDRFKRETEYVANLWRKAGFRCSQERYITLPVYLASLPLMYDPLTDQPGRGLQRANSVNSFNAATLMHVQGDWPGSAAQQGGPLLISRRGQMATVDLFASSTNYNFVIVAQSGSGKSFFANELAGDFLSRNGVVRIFDVGRSYKRFAEENNGALLEFSADNPLSLNPFSDISTHEALFEMMPMIKSLIRQMVFPLTTDDNIEQNYNWEYAAIEKAITAAWEEHRGATGLEHVYLWLDEQEDQRFRDLAFQLSSYAVGRYSKWFNGPRQVHLDNDLIIVELEDLEVDPELQAVVLTLMIHQITKDMYLSDPERKRPKMLMVDEGWRLLGDKQSGGFISKAFRTVRKYRGAAGAITQSFADFAGSDAARAALENASWQFVLKQKKESIELAVDKKWISDDETLIEMLTTVNSDSAQGFSEIFVKGDEGQGVYRFVTDRHSYWMYTTHPEDLARLAEMRRTTGGDQMRAIDTLARQDYVQRRHIFRPGEGSLLQDLITRTQASSG